MSEDEVQTMEKEIEKLCIEMQGERIEEEETNRKWQSEQSTQRSMT